MTETKVPAKPKSPDHIEPSVAWAAVGWLLLAVGLGTVYYAFSQDISLSSGASFRTEYDLGARQVINTGLVQKQLMAMLAGMLATLSGLILMALGSILAAIRRRT